MRVGPRARANMAVSAQAALFQASARKLLSANCCTQVARHLCSSFCARGSVQVSLRKTLGADICAQDAQPELSCGGAPRTTRLRFRVAIFRCDFPVGAARSTLHILRLLCLSRSCRGPGGNRTRDRAIAKAGAQITRQLPKAILRGIKPHGATARALRHARSPQRVRRD